MRLFSIVCASLILFLVGCKSSSLATPMISDSEGDTCTNWSLSDVNAICLAINETSLVIQSNTSQVTATAYGMSLVINGTVFVEMTEEIRIISLEGQVFIGAQGQNRILASGQEVTLVRIDNIAQSPSDIQFLTSNLVIDSAILDNLPRTVNPETLITLVTAIPTVMPTTNSNTCTVLSTWQTEYSVQNGDTLSRIASQFNLTIDELQQGNCLGNSSRITVGQILNVPSDDIAIDASQVIAFRADDYAVTRGMCTILRWDAVNSLSIILDDEPVGENRLLEVCPDETQSYTLSVIFTDNSEIVREITISVQE